MATAAELRRLRQIDTEPGGLHGYAIDLPERERHEAIERTVHADGYRDAMIRLSRLRTWNKHHESNYRVVNGDMRWAQDKWGEKAEEADEERRRTGMTGTRHHPKSIHK